MDDYDYGYDDYDYGGGDYGYDDSSSYDYGEAMPGSEGSDLMYGSDMEGSAYGAEPTYGGDVGAFGNADQPMDWGQYSDVGFNPEEYLAQQGGYTPPGEGGQGGGVLSQLGGAFMKNFNNDPMSAIAKLLSTGTGIYSAIEGNKAREDLARQMRDAKQTREDKLARYGAVKPMQMNRTLTMPQGDLLTAGQRSGGINWFSPTTFTPKAGGGEVQPPRGWLDRVAQAFSRRKADPSLVGTGMAAGAGNAMMGRAYELYKQNQEMENATPLPYDVWVQMRQSGKPMARGSMVRGEGGGQDDLVPIAASPGEYVFSAQDVSDIGDGDGTEGARRLDEMRQKLRAHKKRAASLAPKAKEPEKYLKGSK